MMSDKQLKIRSGYTLIEVLLAVTLGLILMLGVVQMFAMVGNFVTGSQGLMELDQKIRSAQIMLQNDLVRYTSRMTVPADPNSGEGYFRIEEKSQGDAALQDSRIPDFYSAPAKVYGDNDDVLSFTIHDLDSPFIGRSSSGVVYSSDAEVKWFVSKNEDGYFSLYRRVTVLNPTAAAASQTSNGNTKNASLSELAFSPGSSSGSGRGRGTTTTSDTSYRDNDSNTITTADQILDNIVMFDVKVWDSEKKEYVDLGKGTTFNNQRGNIFDTGSQFKGSAANATGPAESGADTNLVVNAPVLANFSLPNTKMAGITLQGIQIHVRTFDPNSGLIRDFTVEQEFVTH